MIQQLILFPMETLITRFSRNGRGVFFDAAEFPWVQRVEQEWKSIRADLDTVLQERDRIPNFQDISHEQRPLTEGSQWKVFLFYAYGHKVEQNCARCPQTARLLNSIPGLKTAMFSILAPGKHIPEHRGPYKGVLRYHLGLLIPAPATACRIRVASEVRSWEEGKSLIFDDSHPHEVWNDSERHRVVLFVDFLRPLPFPLSILNRALIWGLSKTPFITDGVERARNPELIQAEKATPAAPAPPR